MSKGTKKDEALRIGFLGRGNAGIKAKLISILTSVKIVPIIILALIAFMQVISLGNLLRKMAVKDSADALNAMAVENIERLTTDTAQDVARFLYDRDDDIRYLSAMAAGAGGDALAIVPQFQSFLDNKKGRVLVPGEWKVSEDGSKWVPADDSEKELAEGEGDSSNTENEDKDGFHYRPKDGYEYVSLPLYDEITFIRVEGAAYREAVKVQYDYAGNGEAQYNPKKNSPLSTALAADITAQNEYKNYKNTYVQAEPYPGKLPKLNKNEIYVSDVIGKYVGTDKIGMYVESNVGADKFANRAEQAYSGAENPEGKRFEGIVRWAMPVYSGDTLLGYVTMALNHDHIMELVDHITPMTERYTELPDAFDGNYAFIWDYNCRSICHPRHHSIVGYDEETGNPEVPWLEQSMYDDWHEHEAEYLGRNEYWKNFFDDEGYPIFDRQSRKNKPAAQLTAAGFVGLDGRYLNTAPQCTGWMDLTEHGGSGSFYILWSGLYKLTTAAAIPYYTGQYAPSADNGNSLRGFGIVTIGAGLEDFTEPATLTEIKLTSAIDGNLSKTIWTLTATTAVIIAIVVFIAIMLSSSITGSITDLVHGIDRFRGGERQFRFGSQRKDEFGTLAGSFDVMADSIEDSVSNPLSITDMDKNVIYMNESGLKFCNRTLEGIVGTNYSETSVYPANTVYDPILALHEGREAEIYYSEENDRYLRGTANYLIARDGEKRGYIIESHDVTDMVLAQFELEKAMNAANVANEHKGEFLARMSHEIRTPMNAIIGLTGMAQKRLTEMDGKDADVEYLKTQTDQIDASSRHLLGLLNDILDISKIDAGKIELTNEATDLNALLAAVVTMISPRCKEKNITFKTVFDKFEPSAFKCDSLRLKQVLINLLGNAVKFTAELGMIEFKVTKLGQEDGKSHLKFSVRDTGIGIAKENQEAIFQAFEQGERGITRKFGGTGLGLAISRRIVQLFGGDIELISELGEGSEFYFDLWLEETEYSAPVEDEISGMDGKFIGKRVLLVDDVDINRMIVTFMLENTGAEITEADDGTVAVEKFAASPDGYYDIILMDVKMPTMDGYQATDVIRAMDRKDAKEIPIIALTANAFKDDIDESKLHGMNDHVSKPVELPTLMAVLLKYLGE